MNLYKQFFSPCDSVIDVAELSLWVEDKCGWDTHHTPTAGDLWLFCCVDLDHVELAAQLLADLFNGRALHGFAGRASWGGEVD